MILEIPDDWIWTTVKNTDGEIIGHAISRPGWEIKVQILGPWEPFTQGEFYEFKKPESKLHLVKK